MSGARWAVRPVAGPGPAFERAHRLLEAEFGPRGELERRAVIEGWLGRPGWTRRDGLAQRYALLEAVDADGTLAGARDCHLVVDETAALVVVYLAHVVVVPAHRRAGVGGLLREAPVALARAALDELGAAGGDVLLAAEMEPPRDGEPDTVGRLVAYGRAGFRAIDPRAFPYAQPDFRDPAVIDVPRPLPLLAVVRRLGHEDAVAIPAGLVAAYQRHLDAVFATHCRAEHLAPRRERTLAALAAAGPEVPLLPLPRDAADRAALSPLRLDPVTAAGHG